VSIPLIFGILIALNIQTSFLTPPMAMSAFYLKGVAPAGTELMEIFAGILPFSPWCSSPCSWSTSSPDIVLGLPRLIYG
jgi:TRAP-type mannitol/chloroaromatic compound transport system permease large subunit